MLSQGGDAGLMGVEGRAAELDGALAMANKEYLEILKQGPVTWNDWKSKNLVRCPDLSEVDLEGAYLNGAMLIGADLRGANFCGAHLSRADLRETNLAGANLSKTDLTYADLTKAGLSGVDFSGAYLCLANLKGAKLDGAKFRNANLSNVNLTGSTLIAADLSGAVLHSADLSDADLSNADLRRAHLSRTRLIGADLKSADFRGAFIDQTTFANNDLSTVKGLETVNHVGPSTIGVDTLFKSDGKIPKAFLLGAGIPEDFIPFVPPLLGRSIEFYSCFISYSYQDEEFSQRLHSRLRSENLRVWYAPEDMKGGKKLYEEIFSAIQIHDKLLVVLSEHSMKSEWVTTEIRRATKVEREDNRRKLFPIRLVEFDALQKWECFDVDSRKDLAIELREYYIPDFSNWKDHAAFEAEFAKLLRDLKATEV